MDRLFYTRMICNVVVGVHMIQAVITDLKLA